jgi:hypothetical protein
LTVAARKQRVPDCAHDFGRGDLLSTKFTLTSIDQDESAGPSLLQLKNQSLKIILAPWLEICFSVLRRPWRSVQPIASGTFPSVDRQPASREVRSKSFVGASHSHIFEGGWYSMFEIAKTQTQSSPFETAIEDGVSRRRLIRAGLAAAPVMLALKSPSALASGGAHMSCSVWASLKAANGFRSHSPQQVGGTCKNYDYWPTAYPKKRTNTHCEKRYHSDVKVSVPFDGSDFCYKSNGTVQVPNLREVCQGKFDTGNASGKPCSTGSAEKDKLGKHCASMYLNIWVNSNCPLAEKDVKDIWTSCKDGVGTWSPYQGCPKPWTRTDCNEYFDYLCKGTKPASWSSCA